MAYLKLNIFFQRFWKWPPRWTLSFRKSFCMGMAAPPVRRDGRHPVLYLLHGGGDDHSRWGRFTSIERYVIQYGLAV